MSGENTARDYSDKLNMARRPQAADEHIKYGSNDEAGDNHAEKLNDARQGETHGSKGKDLLNDAKNIAELGTPMGAVSLLKYVNFLGDMPFVAALIAALLKDLVDLGTFATVILPMLFSMLCSIFIFMMLLLVGGNSKKGMASSLIKKSLFLIGGGIADSLPGVSFIPIQSLTVAIIYYLTLLERKNATK